MRAQLLSLGGLDARVVDRGGPAAGATPTVVLLHGFGAPGDDLVGLAGALASPARYVFPAAPLELGGMYASELRGEQVPLGYGDGRAWWLIDLARLELDLRRGTIRDRRAEIPEGLETSRGHVVRLVDEVRARWPGQRLVLGGFSQGAMLALDVALQLPQPPDALLLMSGTLIAEAEWAPRFAKLAGVPVVMSHGRGDPLLPFAIAELLRDRLGGAGALVDWHPFDGGHEIPEDVIDAASRRIRTP
jgi:phospholipase/carboxylesterase